MYKPNNNQINKVNNLSVSKENFLLDSVFIKDTDLQFIFKKTEKIVTAIYLITNFLVSEEPLKWDIRNSATSLLKSVMTFSQSSLANKENSVLNLNSEILKLSSLFDLAFNSGFVSNMNYEILNYEISKLSVSVIEYDSGRLSSSQSLFNEDTFHVERMHQDSMSFIKDIPKGQANSQREKEAVSFRGDVKTFKDSFVNRNLDKNKIKKSPAKVTKKQGSTASKGQSKNQERQQRIISEIGKKGEVSIKDIAKVIKDCSEKTLQRELIALVDSGIIKKEGERRWSRYSIAS